MGYNTVLSLSGGLDSSTVLAEVLDQEFGPVLAVGFQYGSKHNPYELRSAKAIAEHFNVDFRIIDASAVFAGMKSCLLKSSDQSVPDGHYEEDNMRQTVVPGRNTIFAAILMGIAQSEGATKIALGVHAGDHHIYPDCRPAFLISLASVIHHATEGAVLLYPPYMRFPKDAIIARGLTLHVPYHLTRTCYKDQEIACGKCGSCQERLTAFAANKIEDPIAYESRELIPAVAKS